MVVGFIPTATFKKPRDKFALNLLCLCGALLVPQPATYVLQPKLHTYTNMHHVDSLESISQLQRDATDEMK